MGLKKHQSFLRLFPPGSKGFSHVYWITPKEGGGHASFADHAVISLCHACVRFIFFCKTVLWITHFLFHHFEGKELCCV